VVERNLAKVDVACSSHVTRSGKMAEWSIATVLKTVVARATEGSNPSLSGFLELPLPLLRIDSDCFIF
jgi:hypothetical protein